MLMLILSQKNKIKSVKTYEKSTHGQICLSNLLRYVRYYRSMLCIVTCTSCVHKLKKKTSQIIVQFIANYTLIYRRTSLPKQTA